MSVSSLDATHALLSDITKTSKPPIIELLYKLGIAKEYLKRLPIVGPDTVAKLKPEDMFRALMFGWGFVWLIGIKSLWNFHPNG